MPKLKKEASTTATSIKGFSKPFGSEPKKKRKKKNFNKPYSEPELFENAVVQSVIEDEPFEEVVRKRGNNWIYYDDETGVSKGSFATREKAWEVQRRNRAAAAKDKPRTEIERQAIGLKPTLARTHDSSVPRKRVKKPGKKKAKSRVKKENLSRSFRDFISENMISYVFENSPVSDDSFIWEKFISKLSKETVMSDPKLKNILKNSEKAETKLLEKSVSIIKGILGSTKSFDVDQKNLERDTTTGDKKLNFVVNMKDNKKTLKFAVKVENGRPLIMFPDESRQLLNSLANDESKLLRAELMHAQETALDPLDDIININKKRDSYLKSVEGKLDKFLNGINLIEMAMLKHLLKNKYKGIK